MKQIMNKFMIGIATMAMFISCQQDDISPDGVADNKHGEEVTVHLSLGVANEQAGTPEAKQYINQAATRAVDDPTTATTTEIKDFYILQFNGIDDDAQLIGTAQYFDYATFTSSANPNGANCVKLVASSQPDAVFVLANTCQANAAAKDKLTFAQGMTLAEFKSRAKSISSQADLFGIGDATNSGTDFPDDHTYHIMLNAEQDVTITAGTSLSFQLKRNIARIKVIINNTTATNDQTHQVTIKTLSLHNVPNVSYYITNTVAAQPDYIPSSETVQTFNYPDETYNADGNTFYVPVNKRGIVSTNTTQNTKGMVAPESSTYLFVDATYTSGGVQVPITYTFYLGADLINDYNLLANNTYIYTINMAKKGNEDYDYRVEDWGPVDFTTATSERANCYILNPAPTYNRQFLIPIDRISTFWSGAGQTETAGYEKYADNTVASTFMNQNFTAYILWTDIDDIGNKVTVDMTDNSGNDAYFTVTVKPGTSGNAVVAVQGTIGGDEILWSWHLWITDYRPDEIKRYANKEAGKYIYPVTGGAMHRYAGTIWDTGGLYENKFIMDRNLGALDTIYANPNASGGAQGVLYYQFGRKDPLPGANAIVKYPKEGLSNTLQWRALSATESSNGFTDATALRYSVKYPLTFIKQGTNGWTSGNKYNPTTYNKEIRWQDPNVQTDAGKSLFDPCPPGYKVSKGGSNATWSDFNAYNSSTNPKPTTNINGGTTPPRNFPTWTSTRGGKLQTGLHYYPGMDDVSSTIFFPASGYLHSGSGGFGLVGSYGLYWSCSPLNATYGYSLYFYSGGVSPSYYYYSRACGFSVRCVQE